MTRAEALLCKRHEHTVQVCDSGLTYVINRVIAEGVFLSIKDKTTSGSYYYSFDDVVCCTRRSEYGHSWVEYYLLRYPDK